ncbi:Glycosyl hydrolases family 2, sugar binding domain [Anatilimnocola aggregata]|uniref:Glycosyl hydrolases family 2, sugar binding domain n=1 Tax=Anatilimnocola aggregata TaxID=2528021 RepID=A0A517YAU5_9BACT|nr:sialate O-acetylesterase [Anatilimnocola aggregata]QDU27353.1 Glycosyl hydrolases family 2, sugar binding domain [Anatilimnocola aggregata]
MQSRPHWASLSLACAFCLALIGSSSAIAQPTGPQPWWPTRPTPLPFVHSLFTSDMVLQRDVAAPIWGWSTPGDVVTITFNDEPTDQPAKAGADGKWMTKIGPFPAGGPHKLSIAGSTQRVELTNVLCGDVWLCSGQSNMNWPVRLAQNAEAEVKQASHPQIRSFTVGFYPSLVPLKLPPPARWEQCTPELARNFSAVGYYFARELNQTQKVPIGIIHSSVGATAAEAWVSGPALARLMPEDFPKELADLKQQAGDVGENYDHFAELEKWAAKVDPESAKKKYTSDPELDTSDWQEIDVPQPWEEAGLGDFDGLVWFRHHLEIPAEWAGEDLLLQLSVIKDFDIVWLNGKLLASSQLKGNTRNYTIEGSRVKPGKNLLTVAILNQEGPGGFCSMPSNMALRSVKRPAEKPLRPAGKWKAKKSVSITDLSEPFPEPKVGHYKTITGLYNGMIAPLEPYSIKGVVWYQGEANGPRWLQYRRLLPTLITDWREHFQSGEFPFLIVSLANTNPKQTKPTEPGWAEIRESQWRTARTVPNTGLANTIDTGDGNIHPPNKQEVGRRLALTARHLVYGEKELIYSGPQFSCMKIEGPKNDRIRLSFTHLGGGLAIKEGEEKLTGFAIAGEDKQFVWGNAVIDGDTIVVSSPEVAEPKHVRYGWAWNPLVNLYNKAGLPAVTFRTDE